MIHGLRRLALRWRNQEDVHSSYVSTVSFSPDSRLIATGTSYPHRAIIFVAETGRPFLHIPDQDDPVLVVRFTPDSRALLTACDGGWVRAWSAVDGTALQSLRLHGPVVRMHCWSGADTVVCQVGEASVEVWDWQRGRQLHVLGCDAPVADLAVAPALGLVAIVLARRAVHLWEPASGRISLLGGGRNGMLGALAFDALGTLLVEGGEAMVRIWDVPTARPLRHLALSGTRYGSISAVALQPGGNLLALGMFRGDHPIEVWDIGTSTLVQHLDEADPIVNEIAFSPDGRLLAAASDDRGVGLSIWSVITT